MTVLPEKLGKQLEGLVPAISNRIEKKLSEDLRAAINNYAEAVNELNDKAKITVAEFAGITDKTFKKRLLRLVLVLVITIPSSAIISHYLLQPLPKSLTVNTNGDITIRGGEIVIWGASRTTVEPNKK